jgi:hypothetical protein
MNVQQIKTIMREWVNVNAEQYPGLRGAHLAGGITTMCFDLKIVIQTVNVDRV